ncbi:MAG: nicotinate phosphoribosyltransferase [Chlamydiia bacterium]|nr:nicotinate phosphoribosyltransferase [Chlamydiia bacterium]
MMEDLTLLTDMYQLMMASAYFKAGLHEKEAVFHLFFRKRPFHGGFAIAAGLESVVQFLEGFKYHPSDLEYLAGLNDQEGNPYFDDEFLKWLETFQFACDVDAMEEGTPVFPHEPLVRVKGPLAQAQLMESPLLNLINFPTLIATKAARIRLAAEDDQVLEFGLRRAQGIDGALTASRSAYIGGCDATSNVLAGKRFGIPVKGTHAHSWVMVFEDEEEAFKTYAKAQPGSTVFLVDTYDTIEGVKKAIEVGDWLRKEGRKFLGVRLDSGDLAYLSIEARRLMDEKGFHDAKIVASNELDETIIADLKRQGAQITVWGVGTNLVTSANQPALDGVYKLSALKEGDGYRDTLKLSEQLGKLSNPGILQVRRFEKGGQYLADMIWDEKAFDESVSAKIVDPLDPTQEREIPSDWVGKDLLKPIFKSGKKVYDLPDLKTIKARTELELKKLHSGTKRFMNPHKYVVGMESGFLTRKLDLVRKLRRKSRS